MSSARSSGSPFVMTTHRIESLSDCIFAFSMTLLVMNFTFPSITMDESQITAIFYKEIAKLDRYILTFALLAVFWITHHQHFHYIKRTDRLFLWIQITILMFIVLIPFTAAWMSAHQHHRITNIVFDANLFILGLLFLLSWTYATYGHRLVDDNIDGRSVISGKARGLLTCGVSLIAFAVSFFHPGWSNYAFILLPVLLFFKPFRFR